MDIPEIDADAAAARLADGTATFIDIRDAGSFRLGHIPGSQNIGDDNIQEFVDSQDKSRAVIVSCYHGNSSMGATAYLLEQGFAEVYSLTGGWGGWGERPSEKSAPPPPPKDAGTQAKEAPAAAPPPPPRPSTPRFSKRRRFAGAQARGLKGLLGR